MNLPQNGRFNCVTIHKVLLKFKFDIENGNGCYLIRCAQANKCKHTYDCQKWHSTEENDIGITMQQIKVKNQFIFVCLFVCVLLILFCHG